MKKNQNVDKKVLVSMLSSFNGLGNSESLFFERFALGILNNLGAINQIASKALFEDNLHMGCIDGRIDNELEPEEQEHVFKYVLDKIYTSPGKLRGDFSISVYNKIREQLILIRDHFGIRPLFYADQPEFIAFATEMKALKSIPGFPIEPDEQWIADSISSVKSEKWRTPYAHIRRLMPGHKLTFSKETQLTSIWDLTVNKDFENISYDESLEIFRKKIESAISRRMKTISPVAAELSGGMDSSGNVAIGYGIAEAQNTSFFALSHAFSENSLGNYFPYKDEREFSKAVCGHIGLKSHLLCDADNHGFYDLLKKNIFTQSGPTQQSYSMFSDTLYKKGKENGILHLLSGFGGDEGVTSQAHGFFNEMAVNGKWEIFRREYFAQALINNRGKFKSRLKFIVRRHLPDATKLAWKKRKSTKWREDKYLGLSFSSEFELRMGIKKRFNEMVIFPSDPDVRSRQYKRIMHNHVSQRFEYSHIDAIAYNIEYSYPLWDIDLLEFYYSLPSEYKFRNGMGRAIYRDSMKGVIPEKIRLRTDKTGATVPTVQQRFLRDYDEIAKLIRRSKELNKYHYLDYDKMLLCQIKFKNLGLNNNIPANPGAFYNSLQILLLQEMERNGEFKSGIRY